ncbi:flagellar hook-associated protein FlgK [Carboxydochorda subterranea]|uniref:Flagellar hook-associated protein 1 n=1 Tax=Carboxydichorda subterranea TaxID=3109565 RepID=A0ABZ1BZE8_9FIRM|nr:flagellar hook-associated protein FlgK [Limnochorda sp. L945t]WRP17881.1 flagellar hook-associated protein FlgK [Limnochorda sp. L945t]
MRSTFFGIELARRALFSQQRAMDVASHNIANANNPAYSRQRAEMVATAPYAPPGMMPAGVAGQVGTGVWVQEIVRLRDAFLDGRIRAQNQLAGRWQVRQDVLEQVEKLFNEPSENGVRVAFDRFWESLQELSLHPESVAVREVVLQRGRVLADSIAGVYRELEALRGNLDYSIGLKVDRLNSLSERLAQLNRQIGQVSASGQRPNDLMDERDAILEEMSRLAPVQVVIRPPADDSVSGEQVAVSIGGLSLVDGDVFHKLVMGPDTSGGQFNRQIFWEDVSSGLQVTPTGGEIGALLEMRGTRGDDPNTVDGYLPELMADFDKWAREFAGEFNSRHDAGLTRDGKDAGLFFVDVPSGNPPSSWYAPTMALHTSITPEGIAAALPNEAVPGGNGNALLLAALKSQPITGLGDVSPMDYLGAMVGRLGVATQEAQTMTQNQELLVNHLKGVRESISGVSLDEEMADLVRFEHAYGAAARAMTAMDEVLDTLIHRTGLVGR